MRRFSIALIILLLLVPSTYAGRYAYVGDGVQKGGGIHDVRAYGAVGDGVTDDTAAIKATITAAGVGTVFIPAGTYLTTSPIDNFPYGLSGSHNTGITIKGAGMDATTIKYTGTSDYAIKIWNPDLATDLTWRTVQYVSIRDLQVDAPDAEGGISFQGCQSCRLENVAIHDISTTSGKAIHAQRNYFTILEDGMTHDTDKDFTSTGKYAFRIQGASAFHSYLVEVTARLRKTGSPAGTMTVSLYTDVAGAPGTAVALTSDTIDCDALSSDAGGADQDFIFVWGNGGLVYASTWYWVVFETSGYTYTNGVTEVIMKADAGAAAGNYFAVYNGGWTTSNDGTNYVASIANKNMQFNHLHNVQVRGVVGAIDARYGIYMEQDSQFYMTQCEINANTVIKGLGATRIWAGECDLENDGEAEPLYFDGVGATTFFVNCWIENPIEAQPLWFKGGTHYFLHCLITGSADWEPGTQVHFKNCSGPSYLADDPGYIAEDYENDVYTADNPYWVYSSTAVTKVVDADALCGYSIHLPYGQSTKVGWGWVGGIGLPRGIWRITVVAKIDVPTGDDLRVLMNTGTPGVGVTLSDELYSLTSDYERYEAMLVVNSAAIADTNKVRIWFLNQISGAYIDISHVEMERIGVDEAPVDLVAFNPAQEDTDGGRESYLAWMGRQSGGEESFLARIKASHDGTSDDEKGKVVISRNDGDDAWSPSVDTTFDVSGIRDEGLILSRENIVTIVASDSDTTRADYICDGTDDGATIQTAIDALPTATVSSEGWAAGPFTQRDALDAVGSWVAIQGDETLSADTGDKQEGTASLKIVGGTTDNPGAKLVTGGESWLTYNTLELWVKADASVFFRITIEDLSVDYVIYETRIDAATTWQEIQVNLSEPYGIAGNVAFNNLDEIHLQVVTATNAFTFRVDNLRLNTWKYLAHDGLVYQSDSISGHTRGTDYYVNFRDGRIKAIVGGGLTSGVAYNVDYQYYMGGMVELLEGTYYIDSRTLSDRLSQYYGIWLNSRTLLKGQGGGTVLKWTEATDSSDQSVILAYQAVDVDVRDLTIDGGYSTYGTRGISYESTTKSRIRNCRVINTKYDQVSIHSSRHIAVDRCVMETPLATTSGEGLDIDWSINSVDEEGFWGYPGSQNVKVLNNTLIGNSSRPATRTENCMNVTYTGNDLSGFIELSTDDSAYQHLGNVVFAGNTCGFGYQNWAGIARIHFGKRDGSFNIIGNTLNCVRIHDESDDVPEDASTIIQGNDFWYPGDVAITISGTGEGQYLIDGNTFVSGGANPPDCVSLNNSGKILFSNNMIRGFENGMLVYNDDAHIVDNYTWDCTGIGVYVAGDYVTVEGHTSRGDGAGIKVGSANHVEVLNCNIMNNTSTYAIQLEAADNCRVDGCLIRNIKNQGIGIRSGSGDNVISDNEIYDCSQGTHNAYDGIRIKDDSDRNIVRDNKIRRAAGSPQARYGIGIEANADYTKIIGNDLYQSGISSSIGAAVSTSIIYDNLEYTFTRNITAVTTTITVYAGLTILNPNNDYILTSAPTLTDGNMIGQIVRLTCANNEPNTATLQDQDTLANSNLQLGGVSRTVGARDVLTLVWDGTDWLEVGYADN